MSSMFDQFSSEARRAMLLAVREARRCEYDFLGTDHLLFGLLCDSTGSVAQVLRALETVPESVLRRVQEQMVENDDYSADVEQLPLTPAVGRVFAHACLESQLLGKALIGPEQLLLGLLRENTSNAGHLLGAVGIRLANAQSELQQLSPAEKREHLLHPGQKAVAGPGATRDAVPTPEALEDLLAAPPPESDAVETAVRAGHAPGIAGPTSTLSEMSRAELFLVSAGLPTRISDITVAGWLFFLPGIALLIIGFMALPETAPRLLPRDMGVAFVAASILVYLCAGWGICKALGIRFRKDPDRRPDG